MELSVGDFIDRLSIVELKHEHFNGEVEEEWNAFSSEFQKLNAENPYWELDIFYTKLRKVNKEIWNYEADLRKGKLKEFDTSKLKHLSQEELLQLAAVGLSAIQIRNVNRKRKQIINEIAGRTGTGFWDIKVNHASEEIDVSSV
jgi:hypothetical protein